MARGKLLPLQAQTEVVVAHRKAAAVREDHVGVLLDLHVVDRHAEGGLVADADGLVLRRPTHSKHPERAKLKRSRGSGGAGRPQRARGRTNLGIRRTRETDGDALPCTHKDQNQAGSAASTCGGGARGRRGRLTCVAVVGVLTA